MKSSAIVLATMAATLMCGIALARDTVLKLPIKGVMESADAKEKLGTGVKFFFGSQTTPKAEKTLGTFTSNKKTNFFDKSDEEACAWAFLSAMISLRDRAIAEGGNAVINIQSYYKKNEFTSATDFECHAGAVTGGVALRGTVVKL